MAAVTAVTETIVNAISPTLALTRKIEQAEAQRVAIEQGLAEATLAEEMDRPGATAKRLRLETDLAAAVATIDRLKRARALSEEQERRAEAAAEAKRKAELIAEFAKVGESRLDAWTKTCAALKTAAREYARFMTETDRMAVKLPTGVLGQVFWNDLPALLPDGRAFPAPIERILAAEMFRIAPAGDDGKRWRLPGAAPLIDLLRLQPDKHEPAIEAVKRANAYLVETLTERMLPRSEKDAA